MKTFEGSQEHPFLNTLQLHWQAICSEYTKIAMHASPWHETSLHNGRWSTVGLYQFGKWLPAAQQCPTARACLQSIPHLFLAGFSVLEPNCHIKPHVGYSKEVLRSHLGLICPQGAWIEVAGQRHEWQEGEVVVFDDTQLHSASNKAASPRVVLIADFFR